MQNVYSPLKIFYHRDAIDALKNNTDIAPFYIRLKPTNICNQHCNYCTYGSGNTSNKASNRDNINHTDSIPWVKMCEMINDMGHLGVRAVTLSGGGEPLTYPNILETVRLLKKNKIALSLISNGQLLKDDIAEEFYNAAWVRISFDSPIESEYCAIRNVSSHVFQQVCKNIEMFAKYKSEHCQLGVNFVIGKNNYQHVYEAAEMLKTIGVNNVKFAAVDSGESEYHKTISQCVLEQIHKAESHFSCDHFKILNNYETDTISQHFKQHPFLKCYTCRLVTVIAADCKIYLCHTRAYDKNAVVADLTNQSLREAWFSDGVQDRLRSIDPKRDCHNFCAYESRNRLLNEYFDIDQYHVNFI